MGFDAVAFDNKELLNLIGQGITCIALCDGEFSLPYVSGVEYTAIGSVKASIDITSESAEKSGIVFNGFLPKFGNKKLMRDKKVLTSSLGGGYGLELI